MSWPDGTWAALDRTLTRVDPPGWMSRLLRASGLAPLGLVTLLLLAVAAWRARRKLYGWSTVGAILVAVAANAWLPAWLEVL